MTRAFSDTPLWPYIGVVACLLILTILAPRSWRPAASHDPPKLAETESPAVAAAIVTPGPPIQVVQASASQQQRRQPPKSDGLFSLRNFDSPRQIARIAPPVAHRVFSEPVERELPNVPSPETTPDPTHVGITPRISPPPADIGTQFVSVVRQDSEVAPLISTAWPMPTDLLDRLDRLSEFESCAKWVERTRFTLQQLHQTESLSASEVTEYLNNLDAGVVAAQQLATDAETAAQRATILRTRYAIQRRLEIWRHMHQAILGTTVPISVDTPNHEQLLAQLASVEERLASVSYREVWRDYLLLDELKAKADSGTTAERRQLARTMLRRLESPKLDAHQQFFIAQPPVSDLAWEVRGWATEPVDYFALLDDLEAYEQNGRTESARSIARHFQTLRWSSNRSIEKLADALDVHYRNANVRVAISGELVNRMLPAIGASDEEIDEEIYGTWVSGTSHTQTELNTVLIPDGVRWRVGVEARGEVESETAANAGVATFYNDALSRYLARKTLLVDRNGVRAQRAEAEANSDTDLTGLRTDFDNVPIIGWLARSIALDEHANRFPRARRAAEERLAARASERLDAEVQRQVEETEQELSKYLYEPMERLGLNPVALDMHTTKDRLVGRYRLAADQQLGAHSPRPQAPSDSLLSVQVHESAWNNILEQLSLENKRSELRDLFREISDTFARPDLEVPDDIREGVTVQFANEEAVRVRCEDGRFTVTIRIAELKGNRRNKWKNFTVRANYVPDAAQLNANLIRQGPLELEGKRIRPRDRIALSGIFEKVLSRTRPFNLINREIAESPQLQDLRVTQFVIAEGWIGVALGPQSRLRVQDLAKEAASDTQLR
jgi:hypothetical protein